MKTKTLFWIIVVLSFLSISCDKSSLDGNNSEENGNKTDKPQTELPTLEETNDVCSKMNDLNFKVYCYEYFDLNGDSKVSMTEANVVTTIECNDATSFAGLEYFTNLKSFSSSSVQKADFRYNKNLVTIDCNNSDIESADLRHNDKLTSISFLDCELLTDVTLPDNLASIENSVFSGCSSLTSIDIPDGVKSIGNFAFDRCYSLTSIDIPDGVTSIGSSAFSHCYSLESIDIPDGVKIIEDFTFNGCSSLETIDIPDGITAIGADTFIGCSSLETVDASQCKNLKHIGSSSFAHCPIKEFILGTSNPYDNCFGYMPDAVLKVPAESVEAYKNSDWADYFGAIEAL